MDIFEMKTYLAKIDTLRKNIDTLKKQIDENSYFKRDLSAHHVSYICGEFRNITLRVLNNKNVIEAIIKAYDKLIKADSIEMDNLIKEFVKLESVEFEVKNAN